MPQPRTFLVVGLPRTGASMLTAALAAHRDTLAAAGVRAPAKSVDEAFRAAVELRREHRAWGLRRKDVEGTWAAVCRRARKHAQRTGDTVVFGHDLLAGAAPDEIALLVDAVAGTEVHVVAVAGPPDPLAGLVPTELDLGDVLGRWRGAVGSPDRLHVLVADRGPESAWATLGELVGFDAGRLPLPWEAGDLDGPLDAHTLALLAESTAALLDEDELLDLAAHWAKLAAEGGYDVRGDLAGLTPRSAVGDVPLAVLRDVLAQTLGEVGRLRARVAELEVSAAARRPRLRFAR